ncbi:MAG: sulfite exporter TauE/SafE family protein [Nitrospiria bacterium]
MPVPFWPALIAGIFAVAALYSSVGHGGASGYLAVLVLAGFARPDVTPVVLILNILVAGIGFITYRRAGHFSSRLLFPFLVTSMPGAFIGGMIILADRTYELIVGYALVAAACRFVIFTRVSVSASEASPRLLWTVGPPIGLALGLLAGMVGVGGGIFLSPLLLIMGWADAKRTGAVSSAFILANSLTGLVAQLARGAVVDGGLLAPLLVTALIGGVLGSSLGASRLSLPTLQRLLGVVLAIAGLKLLAHLW